MYVSFYLFGFPCHLSSHRLLHNRHHTSPEAGTVSQILADVPYGTSLAPPKEIKRTKKGDTQGLTSALILKTRQVHIARLETSLPLGVRPSRAVCLSIL